jgi:cytochrome c biogenesis protein CcdA
VTLLVAFALLAGAVTAIAPCVLPVLPALLSVTGTGGRRRPVGVVAGLTLTFFITIVGLATVVNGVGLADGTTRSFAIVALAASGWRCSCPRSVTDSRRHSRGSRAWVRVHAATGWFQASRSVEHWASSTRPAPARFSLA